MIRFEHVTKRYEDKDALSDLNLEIRDGEIFGLIGHNGAGKTTTISILTSIIEASYEIGRASCRERVSSPV